MKRLRVLLVPDRLPWITGTIARRIAAHNPWIEATICSGEALARLHQRRGPLTWAVDLVHFLTEFEPDRCRDLFPDYLPRVNTIHHVEDWELTRRLMTSCDAIHVVSQNWRSELTAAGAPSNRTVLVPNGVDTQLFRTPRPDERAATKRRLGIRPETTVVGMFARMSRDNWNRKGVDVFVDALQQLRHRLSDLAAVVVGPGWGEVAARLNASGIRCSWQKYIDGHEGVARLYRALDFYWVTSRVEGGPVPLLEAMASGVSCISTPVGVAPELIESGINGLLVPIGTAVPFAEHTAELAGAVGRRTAIGDAARRTVVERLEWKRTVASVGELYTLAMQHAAVRTGRPVAVDPAAINVAVPVEHGQPSEHYLAAIPQQHRRPLWAEEQLLWMRELIHCGETGKALRVSLQGLLRQPLNRTLITGLVKQAVGPNNLHRVKQWFRPQKSKPAIDTRKGARP